MSEEKLNEKLSLEDSLKDIITKELEKGIIEKVLAEKLEKCIGEAVKGLFEWSGPVKKVIEEKVKDVMIPYLDTYDYSRYITKLDTVLVEVLNSSALEHKNLLENFKELMVSEEKIETIKMSEIYEKWEEHVAKHIDTSNLKVCYDDGVSYECVDVSMEFEQDADRNWSSFEYGTVFFECAKDEKMNFELKLMRWKKHDEEGIWTISRGSETLDLNSLRYLDKFSLFLMKLNQDRTKIELDTDCESNEIVPEKEPEPTFE